MAEPIVLEVAESDFAVRVSAGSLRSMEPTYTIPHAWSGAGIAVEGAGTGAHLLHCAVAVCVLNDLFREAGVLGINLSGAAVSAWGGFDEAWASTGICYDVEVYGEDRTRWAELVERVDTVAEIPCAVRAGARVGRRTREAIGG